MFDVCVGGDAHAIACVWRSEANFVELVLSLHLNRARGDWTWIVGLYDKGLYSLSYFIAFIVCQYLNR